MSPKNFITCNVRCPPCRLKENAITRRKDSAYFISRIPEEDKLLYVLESEYTDNRKKVTIRHTECNNTYEVSPENFYGGRRCPHCAHTRNSKGMQKIRNFLNDNLIKYEEEYKYDNCRNIRPLPFDFFLPEFNVLLEYDGEHHFKSIPAWGGEERFVTTTNNDNIKNEFCKSNNIQLIRIKYTEKNKICEILEKYKRSTTIPDTGVGSSDPKQEPPL